MGENEAATAQVAKTNTDLSSLTQVDIDALVEKLPELEEGMEITGEYYQFEDGEEVRCYYVCRTSIGSKFSSDGKETDHSEIRIPAVKLLFEDKSFKICASTMLVGVLSDLTPPVPVKIVKTGTEKGPKGTYDTFRVHPLV